MTLMFQPIAPQMLVQGPPGRPTFIPQVQCRPEMQGKIGQITGILQAEIQQKANNSIQRQAFFYVMSPNMFQNQNFVGMVQRTISYAEYLVFGCNVGYDEAVNQAIMDTIMIEISMIVMSDQRISSQLAQDVIMTCQNWIAKRTEIAQQIANWQRMGGGQMGMVQPMYQQQQPTYQQQQPMYPHAGGYMPPVGYPQQTQRPPVQRQVQALHGDSMGQPSGDPWVSIPTPPPAAPKPASTQAPQPTPVPLSEEEMELEELKQHLTTVNGSTFIRQINKLKPFWPKPVKPFLMFPAVVIHNSVNAYWRFTDGKVTSHLAKSSDDIMKTLDYTLHENDKYLKARTAEVRNKEPDQGAAKAALGKVVTQATIDELLEKLEQQNTVKVDDFVVVMEGARLDHPIARTETTDYHALVTGMIDDKLELDVESCTVSYTALTMQGWSFGPSCAETALALGTAKTLPKLRETLYSLRSTVAYYYWDMLDSVVTKHFNAILRAGLGLDLKIDSFCEDLDDVIGYLQQHCPDRLSILLNKGFQQLRDSTCHMDNTDVLKAAGMEGLDSPTYVLIEDVTLLPVTSVDLGLVCPGEQGVVTHHSSPELYQALKARLKHRHPRTRYTKFITIDNQAFWVYESLHMEDAFVVSTVEL